MVQIEKPLLRLFSIQPSKEDTIFWLVMKMLCYGTWSNILLRHGTWSDWMARYMLTTYSFKPCILATCILHEGLLQNCRHALTGGTSRISTHLLREGILVSVTGLREVNERSILHRRTSRTFYTWRLLYMHVLRLCVHSYPSLPLPYLLHCTLLYTNLFNWLCHRP